MRKGASSAKCARQCLHLVNQRLSNSSFFFLILFPVFLINVTQKSANSCNSPSSTACECASNSRTSSNGAEGCWHSPAVMRVRSLWAAAWAKMATGTDGSSLRLRLGHPRRFYNYDNNSMIIFSYSARDRSLSKCKTYIQMQIVYMKIRDLYCWCMGHGSQG